MDEELLATGSSNALVGELMERCVKSINSCPAHLTPQFVFIAAQHAASARYSRVRLIGRVETITDELPHLLSYVYRDAGLAQRVRAELNAVHHRNRQSSGYQATNDTGALPSHYAGNFNATSRIFNFNASELDFRHLAMVAGAYLVDFVCIDSAPDERRA